MRCAALIVALTGIMLQTVLICHGADNGRIRETQIVQIFASRKICYYHRPWKPPSFARSRATGFFFQCDEDFPGEKGLILTSAHAIDQAVRIKISNGREKRQYKVSCLGICHTADFAVLKMEPVELEEYERRNEKIVPLELGDSDTLRVGDKVTGWGYPIGGRKISKSEEGEISRVEIARYHYSQERWLVVQASLQQNRGNSGGPVIKDGRVLGMAFQGIRESDRINYFIPINIIRRLLPVLNQPDRIPHWRYWAQPMPENLKTYFHLDKDDGGVLINYIIPGGGPHRFGLRAGDVLLSIDGLDIDNCGDVYLPQLEQKVFFGEVLSRKRVGDPLSMKVVREGKPSAIEGRIERGLPRLVPKVFTPANYFIFGGIGFVELTYNCVLNLGKSGQQFRYKYLDSFPERPHQKIVIITEIFPEHGLDGTDRYLKRVEKIDGVPILNIEHLYRRIQELKDKGAQSVLLELAGKTKLALDILNGPSLDSEIQKKYGIHYLKTQDGFSK